MENRRREARPKLYEEMIIEVKRVTNVKKGGRIPQFSATIAIGDRKGKIGIGSGKAKEIPDAMKKAVAEATKNLTFVNIVDGTISHEAIGKLGASRVLLKPASKGTGVNAGGPVRAVLELAGVKDMISKSLGSNIKTNVAYSTLYALKSVRTKEEVAALRGITVEEL
jgi:small subunit ribosomal protein S5